MKDKPLLERPFLEKLERLTLEWKNSFGGLVGGRKPSRLAGAGQEFLDHRNFHAGDDLRAVNWRAYMRFERFFLKTFHIEPRVPVRIVLDVSASMTAGSAPGEETKFEYARRLAAALVYIGLVQLESLTLQPFAAGLQQPFLASGGRHRFQPAENYLRQLQAGGRTNFDELVRSFLNAYPQRGFAMILSDFLSDGDCLRPLQHLADFGHEVLVVQLWTPEDREPQFGGEVEMLDGETGNTRKVFVDERARADYRNAFDQFAAELERMSLRGGGRYVGLSTTEPMENVLFGPRELLGATMAV